MTLEMLHLWSKDKHKGHDGNSTMIAFAGLMQAKQSIKPVRHCPPPFANFRENWAFSIAGVANNLWPGLEDGGDDTMRSCWRTSQVQLNPLKASPRTQFVTDDLENKYEETQMTLEEHERESEVVAREFGKKLLTLRTHTSEVEPEKLAGEWRWSLSKEFSFFNELNGSIYLKVRQRLVFCFRQSPYLPTPSHGHNQVSPYQKVRLHQLDCVFRSFQVWEVECFKVVQFKPFFYNYVGCLQQFHTFRTIPPLATCQLMTN